MSPSSSTHIADTETAVDMALAEPIAVKNHSKLWSAALKGPGTTAKGKAVVRTSRGVVLGSFLITPGHFSHEGRSCRAARS